MRIFIDVGGHFGETIQAALDPSYDIDLIYSFEPVKECANIIRKINDKRITVINAGLLNTNTIKTIFKPGSEGASIFSDHEGLKSSYMRDEAFAETEECEFIKASDFFKNNINSNDYVIMKLNCEGSECDILLDLIDNGEILKITNLLIDFDARKIPSEENKIDLVIEQLKKINFKYHLPEDVQYGAGSHFGGIRQWLNLTGENKKKNFNTFVYHIKNMMTSQHIPFYKLQLLRALPKQLSKLYYNLKNE